MYISIVFVINHHHHFAILAIVSVYRQVSRLNGCYTLVEAAYKGLLNDRRLALRCSLLFHINAHCICIIVWFDLSI